MKFNLIQTITRLKTGILTLLFSILAAPDPCHALDVNIGSGEVPVGQTISVPVRVVDFTNLVGLQFSLSWDPAILNFTQLEQINASVPAFSPSNFNTLSAPTGKIVVQWDNPDLSAVSLEDESVLFQLKFTGVGGVGTQTTINIVDSPTPREASNVNLQQVPFTASGGTVSIPLPGNAPTISNVTDQTTDEDVPLQIPFTVSDTETASNDLQVVPSSGNTDLVSNEGLVISGTGSNRTLQVTPLANAHGQATLTLTVTDSDGRTASDTFVLTVNPVNDAPTIAFDDLNVFTAEETPLEIAFTVGDVDNDPATLLLDVNLPAQDIVTSNGVVFGGSGVNRTVTITPEAQKFGNLTLTIAVFDGALVSLVELNLSVNEVTDPPTVSDIADQATDEDTPTAAIALTVGDPDTPLDTLGLSITSGNTTLVPNTNAVFSGTGANRTLVITPAPNQNGVVLITVNVNDGATTVTDTFVLTVNPVNDPPTFSEVSDQTMDEDGKVVVQFTVDDLETAAEDLDVVVDFDNPNLIDSDFIILGGAGTDRTLTAAPRPDAHGEGLFTVKVTDESGLESQRVFHLTVHPVNDPPFLGILPSTLEFDEDNEGVFEFILGDKDSSFESIALSGNSGDDAVIPNQNIGFSTPDTGPVTHLLANLKGSDERPNPVSTLGNGIAIIGMIGNDILLDIQYQNLSSPITAAHIHGPADPGQSAGVLLNLSTIHLGPMSGSSGRFLGALNTSQTVVDHLLNGKAYINIHSQNHGGGEISGQILGGPAVMGLVKATLNPLPNAFGDLQLDVHADDSAAQATGTVFVSVNSVNDLPVLTLPQGPFMFDEDHELTIQVQIDDVETDADHLVLTAGSDAQDVVANAGLSFSELGSTRTLTIVPVANAHGTFNVTVTLTDADQGEDSAVIPVTIHPVNDLPELTIPVQSFTVDEDTPFTVELSFSDVETPLQDLVVTIASNNGDLIDPTKIILGVNGLEITPELNANGSAMVTVEVDDGTDTVSEQFNVDVNAVNDPPVISDISNQFVIKDFTTQPIAFTISDVETALEELTITPTSSDQTLVPDGNIVVGGTGGNRTLTITPAAGLDGDAVITVTVGDGTDTSEDTFVLTVSDEFPNVLVEADQSMNEDELLEIPFSVDDNATPLNDLMISATSNNPTLLPNTSIFLEGAGSDRTLTVVPNANTHGEVIVTLSVEDTEDHLVEIPIHISVQPVNDPPILAQVPVGLALDEDTQSNFNFLVGDTETPLGNLSITALPESDALVSTGGVTFSSPNSQPVASLTATLNGANERPNPVVTKANGGALLVLNGNDLIVDVFYQNLTSAIIGAHIHGPAGTDGTAGVLVNLQPVHVGGYDSTSGRFSGVVGGLSQAVIDAILGGQAYINIHSQNYGGGEIRGQIVPTNPFAGLVESTLTPNPNAFGNTLLTLTVSDGPDAVSSDIAVTVNPVNDPPVLQLAAIETIDEDQQTSVPVSMSDVETAEADLEVTVQSSNPDLIPANRISLTGAGESLALLLMPLPNAFGSSDIILSIEDEGGLTDTRTLTLVVNPVNDVPTIDGIQDLTMNEDTQEIVSVTIGDVETPAENLALSVVSNNQALFPPGSLQLGGAADSRSLTLAPALNQFGSAMITLEVGDGTDSFQESFNVTVNDVFDNDGAGLDGYVQGGTVFFDANKNKTLDAGEPSTVTDDKGGFLLQVVVVNFDTNMNGTLDPAEGQLVLQGGTDIATGLVLEGKLTAPPNSTVINPLTTLVNEVLNKNPNLTVAQAQAKVKTSLGISADVAGRVDLLTYDPFNAAKAGDADSTSILTASAKVQDTIVQISSLVSSKTGQNKETTSGTVTDVLASKILNDETVNLSSDEKVEEIIVSSATQSGTNLDADTADGVSEIIAGTNSKKDSVAQSAGSTTAAATEISKVQGVAQSEVSSDLASVGAGTKSVSDAVVKHTGTNLTTSVNNATVGDVLATETRTGTFSLKFDHFSVNENGTDIVGVTVVRADGNKGSVTVEVTLSAGTATAGADFIAQTFSLNFAAQEISKKVNLAGNIQNDNLVEGDETVNIALALAAGAPAGAQLGARTTATLTIVDNDSFGTFTFSSNQFSVREAGENISAVTVTRSGGTAGPVSVVVSASEIQGGATAGVDFTAGDITVTFAANELSKRVKIPVINESVVEADETVGLTLNLGSNPPAGAQLGAITSATLTIVNDDFNTAPTIGAIANQSMNEDTTLSGIAVVIGDAEDNVNNLILTASSSNQALVSNAHLVTGGSGANRTLSITPTANAFGTATITVTVDDSQAQTSTTFTLNVNNVNDPPVINPIANFSLNEAQGVLNVPFEISDIDDNVNNLIVIVSSDNPDLLPPNQLILGGSGNQRNLNLTSSVEGFGVANVTVTVSDGKSQVKQTFVVTVNNINDPPVMAPIADQATDEDQSLTVEFSFSDIDNALDNLVLNALAQNQDLFPQGSVTLSRLNGKGLITLKPAKGKSGATVVQVSVSDGEFTANRSFNVLVRDVNDAPTITLIPDVTLNEDESITVGFTVLDEETNADELELSVSNDNAALLGNTGLTLGGSGAERTLTIQPLPNQGGVANVVLTVSDGNTSAQSSFKLTVNAVADAPEITGLTDTETDEDSTLTLAFSVNDDETDPKDLVLGASSSNTDLLKADGVQLSGDGTKRNLILRPVANASGSTSITVTATDKDGQTTSKTIVLTVHAINDLPTISAIPNQTANSGATLNIPFEIGDVEDGPEGLILTALSLDETVVPASGLVLGGQGTQRTLSVIPLTGTSGEAVIRVQVRDSGGAVVRNTFVINYSSPQPALLSVSFTAGKITIAWDGEGQLQAADSITGPYTTVSGATSPFEVETLGSGKFYRVVK